MTAPADIRKAAKLSRNAWQKPLKALLKRDPEAAKHVRRWQEAMSQPHRRYDIAKRAFDGLWVVWLRIPAPEHVSMEWQAVRIEKTRNAAFEWMWKQLDAEKPARPALAGGG